MRMYLAVLIGLMGLLVAACGGGDDATSVPVGKSAATEPGKATTPGQTEEVSTLKPTRTTGPTATPRPTTQAVGPTATVVAGRAGKLDVEIGHLIHYNRTIQVGTTITWTNKGLLDHTTTSGRPADGGDGLWDSGALKAEVLAERKPGETFSYTFTELGLFPYFCTIHPDRMRGWITVAASAEPTPTAVPTPTPTPLPVQEAEEVNLVIKQFTHLNATIKVGTTVTWTNPSTGVDLHTVTSGIPRTKEAGELFESPALGPLSPQAPTPGGALRDFTFTFTEAGEFPYYCNYHPSIMRALITVVE